MQDHRPDPQPPAPTRLTRRHILVGGAAVGSVVALRGLPALGQEDGDTPFGSSSSSTSSTTTTTPSTTTTTPPTTTTAPPLTATPVEPVHPDDEPLPEQRDGFDTLLTESPDRGIMFPVFPNSATSWNRNQDTYGACRSGCTRRHQGEDLMAPKMTKLLAVKSGTVVELRHRSGGNSLYLRGDDGWFYCYLHINNDRPGTDDASNLVANAWGPGLRQFATGSTTMNEAAARGYRVKQGDVVAYCGDSGNAEGSGSHLHFEIRKPASGTYSSETQRMWSSASVNPRESLRNAIPAKEGGSVPPETFRPWDNSMGFVVYQYRDFLGRDPSTDEIVYWGTKLDDGSQTPDWLMQFFLESRECDSMVHSVARLYQAFYQRLPDSAGFNYWMDAIRSGSWPLARIAEQFARTGEFTQMYGSLDDGQYVDLVYRNVLGRVADAAGRQYWIDRLRNGWSRGRLMTHFSQTPEYTTRHENRMHVVACYGVMLERVPTSSELSSWLTHLGGNGTCRDLVAMTRMSSEYSATVASR